MYLSQQFLRLSLALPHSQSRRYVRKLGGIICSPGPDWNKVNVYDKKNCGDQSHVAIRSGGPDTNIDLMKQA